jgi:plasmid stabilization system protein ParE
MKVVWTALALGDLEAIRRYVEVDDVRAATRVVLSVIEAAAHLAATPAIGRTGRVIGTRELVLIDLPYLVPYRVKAGVVEVLRMLHSARRWPKRR